MELSEVTIMRGECFDSGSCVTIDVVKLRAKGGIFRGGKSAQAKSLIYLSDSRQATA